MVTRRRVLSLFAAAAACGLPAPTPGRHARVTDEDGAAWPAYAAGYVADEFGRIDPADEGTVDISTISP